MKTKLRYAVDNSNRLIVKRKNLKSSADGAFAADKFNRLIYWLNEPLAWRRDFGFKNKIVFTGLWRLNSNYDLELILNREEQLVLKGRIISTDKDTLVFEVVSVDKHGQAHIRILKLTGSWLADEYNQICFNVSKKTGTDTLKLEGSWKVNRNQQITYSYEKTNLKTKIKTTNTLTFAGFWQITDKNRLTYILEKATDSRFDFRAQVETRNLYPEKGAIKFRIGIGVKQRNLYVDKIIYLYGAWKFGRRLGLIFQMDYEKRIESVAFGAEINLTGKDEVSLSLTNRRNQLLGINLLLTHRFLRRRDAEVYLRLKRMARESGVEAGVRIPF